MDKDQFYYTYILQSRKDKKWWIKIPKRFDMVQLDEFQIMPNHIHMIIHIVTTAMVRATTRVAPTTIGYIIGAFKSLTTHE